MSALIYTPRTRLRTLNMNGNGFNGDEMTALVSNLSSTFPELQSLYLSFYFHNWEFLREMNHSKLHKLMFFGGQITYNDIAPLAAGLARVPALEALRLLPFLYNGEKIEAEEDKVLEGLLEGLSLSRLRCLETGFAWCDDDKSLNALIDGADKLPALEELVLGEGHISEHGFEALAAAGRAGRWPGLKLFEISRITEGDEESCRRMLQEVWPGLEVNFTSTGGASCTTLKYGYFAPDRCI